jgi:hypothetical protein
MTNESRRKRGAWRGWPQQMIREHGRPALVGLCGGMRVLMVTQGCPAKLLAHLESHGPLELAVDEAGIYVVTPDRSGNWPAGTYIEYFEVKCQIHDGHSIDADRLHVEWFCVDPKLPTGRTVQLSAL